MSVGVPGGPVPAQGPPVADSEDLFRGITTPDWWVAAERRASSAAFSNPEFSADIVSLAQSPQFTLAHLPDPRSGVVQFNVGTARGLHFDTRKEPDPDNPDNHAHANVYGAAGRKQRKKAALSLALLCKVAVVPSFPES
jgi:hypothetical protein